MPSEYTFLLDAPAHAQARIQIAKLGTGFRDPRYGEFDITASEVAKWKANLSRLPGSRAPIDLDHSPEKRGDTEAAGWITAVELDAGVPMATVEWTPLGESAIREKRYLFFSPTYGPYTDEKGETYPDTLIGGALTNRPFLAMPTVSLSRASTFAAAPASTPSPESTPGPDSRSAMEIKTLTTALGLPDDADEAKALDAIKALKATSEDTRSLEARAQAEGMVLLSTADHDKLKAADEQVKTLSESVAALHKARADERFESAFKAALDGGQVDAKEETKTLHRAIYDAKPDEALTLLSGLPKIVNLTARGAGGGGAAGTVTPDTIDGLPVDEDRARLLERAEAIATERKIDFTAAAQLAQAELEGAAV